MEKRFRLGAITVVCIALIVIVGIATLLWIRTHYNRVESGRSGDPAAISASSSAGVVTVDPRTGKITAPAGYSIETLPNGHTALKVPDYKTPIVFGSDMSGDVKQALESQFKTDQILLNKDATNYNAWINLGTLHKFANDFQGAATIWQYVTRVYPTDSVSTDNLGSLYLDYVKDYPKAEMYYKESVARNPHDINAYLNLFALYTTYGYKGSTTPEQLVSQGLKANPNDPSLLKLQTQQ